MTVVEHFRPTWKSMLRTLLAINLYAIPVFILNLLIGSNYLFINRPPDTPSLIDVLGPWPWYLLSLEALAIGIFLILYLPFAIKDWRNKAVVQSPGAT